MKRIFFTALLLIYGILLLPAQEAGVTTGGDFSGSGGKVSFSIGQVFYKTISSGVFSVAQGVQQAYEISVLTGTTDLPAMNLHLSVYPNPTFDGIILKTDSLSPDQYPSIRYHLMGTDGRILINEKIGENELKIGLRNYTAGIYFLRITDENREIKTFKIIKY